MQLSYRVNICGILQCCYYCNIFKIMLIIFMYELHVIHVNNGFLYTCTFVQIFEMGKMCEIRDQLYFHNLFALIKIIMLNILQIQINDKVVKGNTNTNQQNFVLIINFWNPPICRKACNQCLLCTEATDKFSTNKLCLPTTANKCILFSLLRLSVVHIFN